MLDIFGHPLKPTSFTLYCTKTSISIQDVLLSLKRFELRLFFFIRHIARYED